MATPSRTKATPARISIAERERAALVRKSGRTYDEIARTVGFADRSGAARAVQRALDATVREGADALRQLEAERLDALTAALWSKAIDGDERAVDRVLAVMERRARLLGLNAPTKRSIDHISRERFMELFDELVAEEQELTARVAAIEEAPSVAGARAG